MKLVVEELKTELIHTATCFRRAHIQAIRPFIFKYLSPAGTFTFSIEQNSQVIGSVSFTSADIESNTAATNSNYFHGPYLIDFTNPVIVQPGTFQIKLSAAGYSFSESAYFGWVREHERIINNFTDPINDAENPLAVEFWSWAEF